MTHVTNTSEKEEAILGSCTSLREDKEKRNWVFTVIIFSCWIIWKTRCSFVHEGKPIVPSVVINNITNAIREFLGVFESGSLHASRPVVVSTSSSAWQPPPPTGSS